MISPSQHWIKPAADINVVWHVRNRTSNLPGPISHIVQELLILVRIDASIDGARQCIGLP